MGKLNNLSLNVKSQNTSLMIFGLFALFLLNLDLASAQNWVSGTGNFSNEPPCINDKLLSKLDKNLQIMFYFKDSEINYSGIYILLKKRDSSCEVRSILQEEFNLNITHTPIKNLIYLGFTSEDVTFKKIEIQNSPYVEAIYPEIIVPKTFDSSENFNIYISLNEDDNASSENFEEKISPGFLNPGYFGLILHQRGVKLHSYDPELKAYFATASASVIEDLVELEFISLIELAGEGSVASDPGSVASDLGSEASDQTSKNISHSKSKNNSMIVDINQSIDLILLREEEKTDGQDNQFDNDSFILKIVANLSKFFHSIFNPKWI